MLEKSETDLKNEIENEQSVVAQINYLLYLPEEFPLGDFMDPQVHQRTAEVEPLYQTGHENRQEIMMLRQMIEKINSAILMAEKKIYPDYTLGYQKAIRDHHQSQTRIRQLIGMDF
jgi:hypothetical protein